MAASVDNLYFFMLAVTAFFSVLVAVLIVILAVKYRRRKADDVGANIHGSTALEVIWTAIPLLIAMVMFVWGTSVYFALAKPPPKRWRSTSSASAGCGRRSTSPGTARSTSCTCRSARRSSCSSGPRTSSTPTTSRPSARRSTPCPARPRRCGSRRRKAGTYQLFCAEYCGTQHSGMIGKVVAMEPREFQQWLTGGAAAGTLTERRAGLRHARLRDLPPRRRRGSRAVPRGVFGKSQQLANGATVIADESYLRESILTPPAKVVQGYQPLDADLSGRRQRGADLALLAYIKSLPPSGPRATPPGTGGAPARRLHPAPRRRPRAMRERLSKPRSRSRPTT